MIVICVVYLILFTVTSVCQRRIVNGHIANANTGYMVYLVKAPQSNKNYVGWMCGGTIVSHYYVLTAASCIMDTEFVYVISGYRKYISDKHIDEDECTKRIKKKVVETCYLKDFTLNNYKGISWSQMDIALAKVDTVFDMDDENYIKYCSYFPRIVPVNFNTKFIIPGTQVLALGWGHMQFYRPISVDKDFNSDNLRYTSTTLLDKNTCIKQYSYQKELAPYIEKYNLCTDGPGILDINGKFIKPSRPLRNNGCGNNPDQLREGGKPCAEEMDFYDTRRLLNVNSNDTEGSIPFATRRSYSTGPCQNDHGGPLIAWIAGREAVVGVASGFLVSKKMECVGPFIYASPYCVSQFINCYIWRTRRQNCNPPTNYTLDIKDINWDIY